MIITVNFLTVSSFSDFALCLDHDSIQLKSIIDNSLAAGKHSCPIRGIKLSKTATFNNISGGYGRCYLSAMYVKGTGNQLVRENL